MSAAPPPPDFWQGSPQRAAALHCALKLVQRMLTPWPRRGHKLLLLGVGAGYLLPLLWEAGFDVTGVDNDPARIAQARQRMGDRVELAVGALDHTSYGGNSFDFVVIPPLPALSGAPQGQREALATVLAEAVRLTARGLLAAFWNPCSLAGMGCSHPDHPLYPLQEAVCWLPRGAYVRALRELAPHGRLRGRSCLCTPPALWAASAPDAPSRDFQPGSAAQIPPRAGLHTRIADALNTLVCPLPLGALGVLRADFTAGTPLTGLPLRLDALGDNLGLVPRPAAEAAEATMKRKLPPRQSEDICPQ